MSKELKWIDEYKEKLLAWILACAPDARICKDCEYKRICSDIWILIKM